MSPARLENFSPWGASKNPPGPGGQERTAGSDGSLTSPGRGNYLSTVKWSYPHTGGHGAAATSTPCRTAVRLRLSLRATVARRVARVSRIHRMPAAHGRNRPSVGTMTVGGDAAFGIRTARAVSQGLPFRAVSPTPQRTDRQGTLQAAPSVDTGQTAGSGRCFARTPAVRIRRMTDARKGTEGRRPC